MTGSTPFKWQHAAAVTNPVLTRDDVTDVPAMLVADPFMCHSGGQWYLFCEIVNHLTHRGEIGVAVSQDAYRWKYQGIVLAEPFHLSYPYVFEWQGEHYMIPEGCRGGGVDLYRAADFPKAWQRVATLLSGARYKDSSIFEHGGHWWLFTDAGNDTANPVLRLYYARDPLGPWQEHPRSPVVTGNPHVARPGGRVIVVDDTPVRFAQDVYPVYGTRVTAFRISTLTPTEYEEEPAAEEAVLAAGNDDWNRHGMHHVDAHRRPDGSWVACVDGCTQRVPQTERDAREVKPPVPAEALEASRGGPVGVSQLERPAGFPDRDSPPQTLSADGGELSR